MLIMYWYKGLILWMAAIWKNMVLNIWSLTSISNESFKTRIKRMSALMHLHSIAAHRSPPHPLNQQARADFRRQALHLTGKDERRPDLQGHLAAGWGLYAEGLRCEKRSRGLQLKRQSPNQPDWGLDRKWHIVSRNSVRKLDGWLHP